nr:IMV entry-fusion membrane protein [Wadden Sea poxvirus]
MDNDIDIYNFCDSNKNNIKCRCLYPNNNIIDIGSKMKLPYYCWYNPCKRSDALLTTVLKQNISKCNLSNCNISLGHVEIKNGLLDIRNVCGSKSFFVKEIIPTKYLNQNIHYLIINPKWIPIALIAISLISFII